MDKQSKSRRKLPGRGKQSSLVESFSKSQRKGKQRVHASAANVASGTSSSEPVVIVLEDDPVGMGIGQSDRGGECASSRSYHMVSHTSRMTDL